MLPLAAAAVPQSAAARSWSARQGAIAASLIIAALLFVAAAGSRLTEPTLPQFIPAERNRAVSAEIDKLSPAEAWKIWAENYRQLTVTGFVPQKHQLTDIIEQVIDQHRRIQLAALVAAGLFAVAAVALWLTSPHRG